MKKRFKLITTIASLCLAVALMAFGVYAATEYGFSVTTDISFTATAIDGTWELTTVGLDSDYTNEDITGQDIEGTTITLAGTEKEGDVVVTYTVVFTNNSEKDAVISYEDVAITGDDATMFEAEVVESDATCAGKESESATANTATYQVKIKLTRDVDTRADVAAQVVIAGEASAAQ